MKGSQDSTKGQNRIFCAFLLMFILLAPGSTHDREVQPEFDVELPNLTAKMGTDISFTCIVKHLNEYKVAWIRSEDKAIIALHNHMVTHNHRFSVTHNGHNTWTLHIKNVQQNDTGSYMCQINTDPQRSTSGTLEVVVPADIIDEETSNDVMVSEGQPETLRCKATGYPPPKVRWVRQDKRPLPISKEYLTNPMEKVEIWEGETLPMKPLQRLDTGSYLCLANNSVPPLVSKRVMVFVQFHPLIKVSNQLVATHAGNNATLECYVEALRPVLSWFRKDGQLLLNQPGKLLQETEPLKEYSLIMRLTIANLQPGDFGEYNCSAGNALGTDLATIKLHELPAPPTTPRTTTTTPEWKAKHAKHNNDRERDLNGNTIKHSKDKRKQVRNKSEHYHRDYESQEGGGDVIIGEHLTTSSSLSSSNSGSGLNTGLGKRKQKEASSNTRLYNSEFAGGSPSSSSSSSMKAHSICVGKWLSRLNTVYQNSWCLPLSLIPLFSMYGTTSVFLLLYFILHNDNFRY